MLKKAYRRKMMEVHPDKFAGSVECAQSLTVFYSAAYDYLSRFTACAEVREEVPSNTRKKNPPEPTAEEL